MQKLTISYATTALGIIIAIIGIYMHFALGYHGKAYAVIALGVLALIAGVATMIISRRSTQK